VRTLSALAVWCVLGAAAQAQTITRLSVGLHSGPNFTGTLANAYSPDGTHVAFQSASANLVPGDTNAAVDIFVLELSSGAVERASVANDGSQSSLGGYEPAVSSGGRYVAFSSNSTELVAGDTNNATDVFVRDRLLGTTELVSVSSGGVHGNTHSRDPVLSADGRFVAFESQSSNLVAGAGGGQIFLRDRTLGTTVVVSVSSSGALSAIGSHDPAISADGRFVVFQSASTNLVPGDAAPAAGGNGWDVFVRDTLLGTTELVSATPSGGFPNAGALRPAISGNGRYVGFESGASDLTPGVDAAGTDVFVRDLLTLTTVCASNSPNGAAVGYGSTASLSADGRKIAFVSTRTGFAPQELLSNFPQAYRRDLDSGATELVSASECGVAGSGVTSGGYWSSVSPTISPDGQRVAFASYATTLVENDIENAADLYLRDFNVATSGPACRFCRAPLTTSGCTPLIDGAGAPSATSGSGFAITVANTEGQRVGRAFFNLGAGNVSPWAAGSTSYLCMSSAGRLPVQNSNGVQGACDGLYVWDWNAHLAANPTLASNYGAGRAVFVQAWFRDAGAPTGSNLSAGLQFLMGP
jgi:Tol biopolymer transport system component